MPPVEIKKLLMNLSHRSHLSLMGSVGHFVSYINDGA